MAEQGNLKQFSFTVTNERTGEATHFIGQGETVKDAFAEGIKNVTDAYRANSSGKKTHEHGLAVRTKGGAIVPRTLKQFESNHAFDADEERAGE